MIDLSPHHLETVQRILAEHLPDYEVRAFGSRATWTAWEYSDLDLAVVSPEPLDRRTSANLREALEESDLPIRVDVVEWTTLTDGFRQAIEGDLVALQDAATSRSWRDFSIGDIAQVVGGGTPSTKDPDNFHGDIPWLTPKDLSGPHDRYVSRGARNLSQRGLDGSSATLLPANSVLLSTRAPIGYVALAKSPTSTNQGFRSLITNEHCDPQYLYYWLTANTDELERHASGSTFRELSGSSLKNIRVRLPPLSEQRRIADILGALDDKIELNRRISQTLEAMAQALFKSWFVDFDPVRAKADGRPTGLPPEIDPLFPDSFRDSELGEIPDGWGVGSIADVCTRIENGGTPRRLEPRFWGGSINWFKTAELSDSPLLASGEHITDEGLSNSSCKLWPRGTVLIALYASPTVGRLGILEVPATANQACSALQADPAFGEQILFYTLLEARDHLQNIAVGAAQQNISQRIVRDLPIIMPPTELAQVFQSTVQPQYDQRVAKLVESRALAETRDALIGELLTT